MCAFGVVKSIRTELILKECFDHSTDSEGDSRAGAEYPLILKWMSATDGTFHPLSLRIHVCGYLCFGRYCLPSLHKENKMPVFGEYLVKSFWRVFLKKTFSYCWVGEKIGEAIAVMFLLLV